jgi:hypothetical protein
VELLPARILPQRLREQGTDVTETGDLLDGGAGQVRVIGGTDPSRNEIGRDRAVDVEGSGERQLLCQGGGRAEHQVGDDVSHRVGEASQRRHRGWLADHEVGQAEGLDDHLAAGFEMLQHPGVGIDHGLPAADHDRGGGDVFAGPEDRRVRGAAPDVDVHDGGVVLGCPVAGTGAAPGDLGFQARPGDGDHEFARQIGQTLEDRFRVAGAGGFAGDDDRPGLHLRGVDVRAFVLAVDHSHQRPDVDLVRGGQRCQMGFALVEDRALVDVEARYQADARVVADRQAREDELTRRRSDVDPDAEHLPGFRCHGITAS